MRSQACMDRFKGALEFCELEDLGSTGDIFTWRNKQTKGSTHIQKRLDRAVANGGWRMAFPLLSVKMVTLTTWITDRWWCKLSLSQVDVAGAVVLNLKQIGFMRRDVEK